MKYNSLSKIRLIAFVFCTLFIFSGCNDEDNINAIFVGKTWYLGNFYTTTNWKDDNNSKPVYRGDDSEGRKAVDAINAHGTGRFSISFHENTFTAIGLGNTFSGTWRADGKKNTISMVITEGSMPSPTGDIGNKISRDFYTNITNVQFYRGNTIFLKLFPEDKKSFMQFSRKRAPN